MAKKYKDFVKAEFTNPRRLADNFGIAATASATGVAMEYFISDGITNKFVAIAAGVTVVFGLSNSFFYAAKNFNSYNSLKKTRHHILKTCRNHNLPYSEANKIAPKV